MFVQPRRTSKSDIRVRRWLTLVFTMATAAGSFAFHEARGQAAAPLTVDQLLQMSPAQLNAIYQQGVAAGIPEGPIKGTAILSPGTKRTRALSRGARLMWQGKVIEHGQTTAVNRFFGVPIIRGQLYSGTSWLDGRPSLILDYVQTSTLYADNRDEIRLVGPGLYLGLMYDRTTAPPHLSMYFALEAHP